MDNSERTAGCVTQCYTESNDTAMHVRLTKLSVDIWIFWAFVAISLCDQLEVPKMYRIVGVFVIMKCIMSVVKKCGSCI